MKYKHRVDASALLGKTITSIDGDKSSEKLMFHFDDGSHAVMLHNQSCCESVEIEDIAGEFDDLIGSPLLQAEESRSEELSNDYPESQTWTFYKFATIKGGVTIRWYGTSNGYYSESVDIELTKSPKVFDK
jgi:hypothetical protein